MDEFGWRFWLSMMGAVVATILGGFLFYKLFGWAWYTFGFLAAFGLLALVLIVGAYAYDRRDQRRRGRITA